MGQVRTSNIKNIGNELLERYPDRFTTDFEKNKEVLDEFVNVDSKKTKNTLAGYITHIAKKMEKLKSIKVSYQPPIPDRRKRRRR